ncbi:hypothetical protein METBIDRAFT_37143 [Metschnikowia bicuspidata var. bicuspidata NRRL YB-4993]|uniref:Inositol-pentakisphosphate 2-kinase n=1 Tax=Metschnikowia bicuspidata var. bicuspidata NRRL YB-4993 TaxID=869754 RepID=A0A1A0HIT7_9ASCO|nr:hypothetical protein METBIDRAFT_37143 [Metschnikowia bicuspidata var. bicuspidata NRRL YB-4993]OBA23925.1 hypothetical protein METBIDRAFT_37143 [Metschnikowia bicuspidata var. bicuspidata NRRL YB-4993]
MDITQISNPSEWRFVARGNANAVYQYNGLKKQLKRKVLRMRIKKSLEQYVPTLELYNFLSVKCEQKLQKYILETELVKVTPRFISELETQGFELMASEHFAFLMDNILYGEFDTFELSKNCKLHLQESPPCELKSIILELKPKWLYDCKTNYCRNCSLNQYRNLERHFCPLDFLKVNSIGKGINDFLSKVPKNSKIVDIASNELRGLLGAYLARLDNVFQTIKVLQEIKDTNDIICNVKCKDDISDDLLFAMTLRDVGVFLIFTKFIPEEKNETLGYTVTAHVYDLDLKLREKYEYWKATDLLLEDYYNACNKQWSICNADEYLD